MSLSELMIDIPAEHEANVFGQFDAYAKKLERTFHVTLIARDGSMKIVGENTAAEKTHRVLTQLLELSRRGNTITEQNVDYAISLVFEDQEEGIVEIDRDLICHTLQGKPIKPKTLGQKKYVDSIREGMITFGLGPAGTGKTYLAMAMAITAFKRNEVNRIILTRPAIEAGEKLGKFAATLLGPDDQIAIVAHVKGVSTAVEREEGFRKGLGDLAKNIVEVVYCDSQYEKSRKLTQELMEKYPNLKMVAGMNEYSSVGAARAVKAAGAKDRIQVVGVDSSQEAVQLMENGVFKGLVVQKAFKMGYIGVKETILMLRGKSYEKDINSGCELVTPDNMYDSEIEKLLFPFNTLKLS